MSTKINANDMVTINVINADNQMKIYLNGRELYTKSTEHDPTFSEELNISSSDLRKGYNSLLLAGSNWGGPAHYRANVTVSGKVIAQWDDRIPAGNGIVWDASMDLELV